MSYNVNKHVEFPKKFSNIGSSQLQEIEDYDEENPLYDNPVYNLPRYKKDDYLYVTLVKGSRLFSGVHAFNAKTDKIIPYDVSFNDYNNLDKQLYLSNWFGLLTDTSYGYGDTIVEYQVIQDVEILYLDDQQTIESLIQKDPRIGKSINIDDDLPCSYDNYINDKLVFFDLCKQKFFNGYLQIPMPKCDDINQETTEEIFLCDLAKYLQIVNVWYKYQPIDLNNVTFNTRDII